MCDICVDILSLGSLNEMHTPLKSAKFIPWDTGKKLLELSLTNIFILKNQRELIFTSV